MPTDLFQKHLLSSTFLSRLECIFLWPDSVRSRARKRLAQRGLLSASVTHPPPPGPPWRQSLRLMSPQGHLPQEALLTTLIPWGRVTSLSTGQAVCGKNHHLRPKGGPTGWDRVRPVSHESCRGSWCVPVPERCCKRLQPPALRFRACRGLLRASGTAPQAPPGAAQLWSIQDPRSPRGRGRVPGSPSPQTWARM